MVVVGVVTGGLVGLVAAIWTVFLLIAMNGFTGEQAGRVLAGYAVVALLMVVGSGVGAARLAAYLSKGGSLGFGRGLFATLLGFVLGSVGLFTLSLVLLVAIPGR